MGTRRRWECQAPIMGSINKSSCDYDPETPGLPRRYAAPASWRKVDPPEIRSSRNAHRTEGRSQRREDRNQQTVPDVADCLPDLSEPQGVLGRRLKQCLNISLGFAQPERPVLPLDDHRHPVLYPCRRSAATLRRRIRPAWRRHAPHVWRGKARGRDCIGPHPPTDLLPGIEWPDGEAEPDHYWLATLEATSHSSAWSI